MVIPISGGQLRGPVPAELSQQFWYIKYTTLAMMYMYAVRLAYDIIWIFYFSATASGESSKESPEQMCREHDLTLWQLQTCKFTPWTDVNLLLNVMIGIWLLKDDITIKKTYDFLTARCCYQCGQGCPGGMSCLLVYGIINFVEVVVSILRCLEKWSEVWCVSTFVAGLSDFIGSEDLASTEKLMMLLFFLYNVAYIVMHIAMVVTTIYTYQAFKMAMELGLGQDPMMLGGAGGDGPLLGGAAGMNRFAPPPSRPPQGGQSNRSTGQSSYRPPGPSSMRTGAAPQQQRFVPFSGQGHSLGSG